MKAHKNARTTHYSRQILVERIAQGLPAWQVAQDLGVSRRDGEQVAAQSASRRALRPTGAHHAAGAQPHSTVAIQARAHQRTAAPTSDG